MEKGHILNRSLAYALRHGYSDLAWITGILCSCSVLPSATSIS